MGPLREQCYQLRGLRQNVNIGLLEGRGDGSRRLLGRIPIVRPYGLRGCRGLRFARHFSWSRWRGNEGYKAGRRSVAIMGFITGTCTSKNAI